MAVKLSDKNIHERNMEEAKRNIGHSEQRMEDVRDHIQEFHD